MPKTFYLFKLVLIFPIINCFAQHKLKFENINTQHGLPHSIVRGGIYQDSDGYLWFATANGASRYNGKEFTNYYPNKKDPANSLPHHIIVCFVPDSLKNLWIVTQKGVGVYDNNTGKIKNLSYNNDYGLKSSYFNEVQNFVISTNNYVWFSSDRLYRINTKTKETTTFLHETSFDLKGLTKVNDDIWVLTTKNLYKIVNNKKPEAINLNLENIVSDKNIQLSSLNFTNNFLYFVINNQFLVKFDVLTERVIEYYSYQTLNIPKEKLLNISIVSVDNKLLLGTEYGFYIFDLRTSISERYLHNPYDKYSIKGNRVDYIFLDRNKHLWLCVFQKGLNKTEYFYNNFHSVYNIPGDPNSLPTNNVMSFYEDKQGILWIGTYESSIIRYNPSDQKYTLFKSDTKNQIGMDWGGPMAKIMEDKSGNLYFLSWINSFYVLEKSKNPDRNASKLIFTNIYDDEKWKLKFERWALRDGFIDEEDNLWIAGFKRGAHRFNLKNREQENFDDGTNDTNRLGSASYWCINKDINGEIWAGSSDKGLHRYNPKTNFHKRYRYRNDNKGIPSDHIKCIYPDTDGTIWLGTGGGLCHFDPVKEVAIKNYSQEDGLSNNVIYGIMEDNNGNFWLTSDNGLTRFNKKTGSANIYGPSNGLLNTEYNINSFYKSRKGELFIGGAAGFDRFFPDKITHNPYPAIPVIEGLKIGNIPVLPGDVFNGKVIYDKKLSQLSELNLTWKENDFSIYLGALHYSNPSKNQIAYMLEGYHDNWLYTTLDQNEISFSNLPGGNYTLLVKAANADGVWCKEPVKLKISISPPFWKTWWFITILGLSLTGSIWSFIKKRERWALETKRKLEEEIDARTSEVIEQNQAILQAREREKVQNWVTEGYAQITGLLTKSEAKSLREISDQTISAVARYVNAKTGIIVLAKNEQETELVLEVTARYAPNAILLEKEYYKPDEGYIGKCFTEKNKIKIQNPPENYSLINSGLGEATPEEILLIPLKTEKFILGVMELGFFEPVKQEVEELLENLSEVIALNYNSVILNEKTKYYLEQVRQQQEEQRAQEEELRQNLEELFATQEEIVRREKEYQEKIKDLERRINDR